MSDETQCLEEKQATRAVGSRCLFNIDRLRKRIFGMSMAPTRYMGLVLLISTLAALCRPSFADGNSEQCYAEGVRYQHMAEKFPSKSRQYFLAALKKYQCAAALGHAMAAYSAAALGDSGQVQPLADEELRNLLEIAIKGGVADAMVKVAIINCERRQLCDHPASTQHNLQVAIVKGDGYAATYLGALYERGALGKVDLHKAYSCYLLSEKLGSEFGKKNVKRLVGVLASESSEACLEK